MATKTKVIVAGAGIAGPVLALFLKTKGYEPVIYEKINEVNDVGLSILIQPNGLRVLNLIPGLLDKINGIVEEKFTHSSAVPGDEGLLASFDISMLSAQVGFGLFGVMRSEFHRTLIAAAEEAGVRIFWGHQLVALEQHDDHVNVAFANGAKDSASFVVGCDGLHSDTRVALFGREEASYTGLTQTGGVCDVIPDELKDAPRISSWYGDGSYMLSLTMPGGRMSWAVCVPEPEAKESWRAIDVERQKAFQAGPHSQWPFGAGELVRTATRIVKYGLYDRPELKTWHKGRVVLVGDAAHPTSPHLGQGANQAFEDIYHIVRLLVQHNPSAVPPPTAVLDKAFGEYSALRVPRTSQLVQRAREMGKGYVVQGPEACRARNEALRALWNDKEAMAAQVADMYLQPFVGQSAI